jgi:hypothetical protein
MRTVQTSISINCLNDPTLELDDELKSGEALWMKEVITGETFIIFPKHPLNVYNRTYTIRELMINKKDYTIQWNTEHNSVISVFKFTLEGDCEDDLAARDAGFNLNQARQTARNVMQSRQLSIQFYGEPTKLFQATLTHIMYLNNQTDRFMGKPTLFQAAVMYMLYLKKQVAHWIQVFYGALQPTVAYYYQTICHIET